MQFLKKITCCTSAVVLRNNSIYLVPINSLCLLKAFAESSSRANSTKASPVARPSGFLTNNTPSSPSITVQAFSKNSIYNKNIYCITFSQLMIVIFVVVEIIKLAYIQKNLLYMFEKKDLKPCCFQFSAMLLSLSD